MGAATHLTLRGRSVVALRAKLPLLAAGAPTSWVEMAYESEWKGHHAGSFAFTPAALESIAARFTADENPIPVTYGHPEHGGGNPVPAAGWIQEMEVRHGTDGAELWGLVEWTATAADLIRAGEYRYCSVVVDFAPIDRASGEPAGAAEMYELGLTNSPFLPGMTPITLSRVGTPARAQQRTLAMATPMDPAKMVEGVAKSLGLKKDATLDEIKALLDAVFAFVAAMPGSASKGPPPEVAAAAAELSRFVALADFPVEVPPDSAADAAEEDATGIVCDKLMSATGLADPAECLAFIDANGDALKALADGSAASGMASDAAPALAAQLSATANESRVLELTARASTAEKRLVELEADLAKRTAAEREQRIAANFSRLVTEGKAGESERATFLSLSGKSEDVALSAYESRPALLPPTGAVVTGSNAAPPKVAGKVSASSADPTTRMFLSMAKADGLRGKAAEERAAVLLAAHHERNTDA